MAEGRQTLLGANPWAAGRLQPDFVLDALLRTRDAAVVDALLRKLLPEDVRQHLIWQRVRVGQHGPPNLPSVVHEAHACAQSASKPVGTHAFVRGHPTIDSRLRVWGLFWLV